MPDPITHALNAVSAKSPCAFAFTMAAGAASSLGPCVAPRFMAVAALVSNADARRTWRVVLSFVGGLTAVYAAFGAGISLLGHALRLSGYVYVIVAAALGASALRSLWSGRAQGPDHVHRAACNNGAAFFLGASFGLVLSPCCTPMILGILAYTSAAGDPAFGSALLAAFALGHALPILAVAGGMRGFARILGPAAVREAAAVVSAAIMLALAGYYAVLA